MNRLASCSSTLKVQVALLTLASCSPALRRSQLQRPADGMPCCAGCRGRVSSSATASPVCVLQVPTAATHYWLTQRCAAAHRVPQSVCRPGCLVQPAGFCRHTPCQTCGQAVKAVQQGQGHGCSSREVRCRSCAWHMYFDTPGSKARHHGRGAVTPPAVTARITRPLRGVGQPLPCKPLAVGRYMAAAIAACTLQLRGTACMPAPISLARSGTATAESSSVSYCGAKQLLQRRHSPALAKRRHPPVLAGSLQLC